MGVGVDHGLQGRILQGKLKMSGLQDQWWIIEFEAEVALLILCSLSPKYLC